MIDAELQRLIIEGIEGPAANDGFLRGYATETTVDVLRSCRELLVDESVEGYGAYLGPLPEMEGQ